MVNQIGSQLIIFICWLIVNLIKPGNGAYYEFNQNPQALIDNEDLIAGYEPGILSQKSLQVNL